MNTHLQKPAENSAQLNDTVAQNKDALVTLHFVDNRPEAVAHAQAQDSANDSHVVKQLMRLQKMVSGSGQVRQTAQLQSMANSVVAPSTQSLHTTGNIAGLPHNSKSSGVVQRVLAVQINPDEEGQIESVTAAGRPGSLWPQERHHTTPWQSYVDTVSGVVTGLSFSEAIASMNELYAFLMSLPGMSLIDELEDAKKEEIDGEIVELNLRKGQAEQLAEDSPLLALRLQQYIKAWLTVRSKLPLSQADKGGGAGDVAGDTENARTANCGGDVENDDLKRSFLQMFDFKTVNTLHDGQDQESENTDLGLDEGSEIPLNTLRGMMFKQHAMSMKEAYPVAFAQVFDSIDEMIDAMEQHFVEADESEYSSSDD